LFESPTRRRQFLIGIDFHHGKVGLGVSADHRLPKGPTVSEVVLVSSAFDDMVIRQHQTVRVDNDPDPRRGEGPPLEVLPVQGRVCLGFRLDADHRATSRLLNLHHRVLPHRAALIRAALRDDALLASGRKSPYEAE
jgi:hypothetical protein